MLDRVPSSYFTSLAMQQTRLRGASLGRLQEQLATGLRVNRPSDDPATMASLLSHQSTISRIESEVETIQFAKTYVEGGVSGLLEVEDLMVAVKRIVGDSKQSSEPDVLAQELGHIMDRLGEVANRQIDGRYIFSGIATNRQPFELNEDGVMEYGGAITGTHTRVATSINVYVNTGGQEIFASRDRAETRISGTTGAAAGSGVDTAEQWNTLQVRHTATAFAGGSGIRSGASVDQDSIIGPPGAHVLTIVNNNTDGQSGTVSLNGGAAIPFTSADTDLRLSGPQGELLHLDFSSLTSGFSGTVDITADGTMSIDGGVTEVPITFEDNQQLVGPDGRITFVDSTQIRREGDDTVEYVGVPTLFETLEMMKETLANKSDYSETEWVDRINHLADEVDRHADVIYTHIGRLSLASENLDAVQFRHEDVMLQTKEAISNLASADIAEVVLQMQNEQNSLNYAYASTARLFDTSLLDFI
ncbi:MAG: flagellar hook-associated protein FlgL [Planctomycetales bacterium]|nr:flagellar hook-associated protein FlgL [Planctomycetales bacterium]